MILSIAVDNSGFPYNIFKGIPRTIYARIIEAKEAENKHETDNLTVDNTMNKL